MSNLSKGGTKKDTKMRIRAFPVSTDRFQGALSPQGPHSHTEDVIEACPRCSAAQEIMSQRPKLNPGTSIKVVGT